MKCRYCNTNVVFEPGCMMVEGDEDGEGFICHEECYQQSGEDKGYVQRLYEALEELDEDY